MPCDKDGKLFLHGLTGSLEHHNTIVSHVYSQYTGPWLRFY